MQFVNPRFAKECTLKVLELKGTFLERVPEMFQPDLVTFSAAFSVHRKTGVLGWSRRTPFFHHNFKIDINLFPRIPSSPHFPKCHLQLI
jgi:hypothetical protein